MKTMQDAVDAMRSALKVGKAREERRQMEKAHAVMVTYNQDRVSKTPKKEYPFATTMDLHVGDVCVVRCATGVQCVTVSNDCVAASPFELAKLKWIVFRIDVGQIDNLEKRVSQYYREHAQYHHQLETLRGQMRRMLTQQDKIEMYRLAAEDDFEMAKLYSEYYRRAALIDEMRRATGGIL